MIRRPGILYSCVPSYEMVSMRRRSSTSTEVTYLVHHRRLGLDSFNWEIRGTDLLRNTSSFTFLDIGLTNLTGEIENHGK